MENGKSKAIPIKSTTATKEPSRQPASFVPSPPLLLRQCQEFLWQTVFDLPLEALALEIALESPALVERAFLVVRQVGVFGRPAPGRRQEELLPVVHPQLGDAHLVALDGLLATVAREPVRERLERVGDPRARVRQHLQP